MKTILHYSAIAMVSVALLAGCKKEETTNTTNNNNNTNTPNKLCDGNGENSYFPLKAGNKWTYALKAGTTIDDWTVGATKVFNSKTYFSVPWNRDGALFGDQYFRTDANGDVYSYDETSAQEYLFIPANPTDGQTWPYLSGGSSREITATGVTQATTGCNYTGLIEVSSYNGTGTLISTYYFKKGLGKVYDIKQSNSSTFELKSVVLN